MDTFVPTECFPIGKPLYVFMDQEATDDAWFGQAQVIVFMFRTVVNKDKSGQATRKLLAVTAFS